MGRDFFFFFFVITFFKVHFPGQHLTLQQGRSSEHWNGLGHKIWAGSYRGEFLLTGNNEKWSFCAVLFWFPRTKVLLNLKQILWTQRAASQPGAPVVCSATETLTKLPILGGERGHFTMTRKRNRKITSEPIQSLRMDFGLKSWSLSSAKKKIAHEHVFL